MISHTVAGRRRLFVSHDAVGGGHLIFLRFSLEELSEFSRKSVSESPREELSESSHGNLQHPCLDDELSESHARISQIPHMRS